MYKLTLAALMAVLMATLALLPLAAQSGATATRSFGSATVAAGGSLTVTIAVSGVGQFGSVTETLPAGFTYVSSPHPGDQITATGQDVMFTLFGESSVTYTVTASSTAGSYTFSGELRDSDRNNHAVGGATAVTVTPSPDAPAASRSISPGTVDPDGRVTVRVSVVNYGGTGTLTETLPAGFTYVSSQHPAGEITATEQKVEFTLSGESSVTYTVTASSMAGPHTFSGTLTDSDTNTHTVGGGSMVTVRSATATRSIRPSTVSPGGTVTVTMAVSHYGPGGWLTETLPAGFTYVSSSLDDVQVVTGDREVRFTLQGESRFSYTVTASDTTGPYTFTGQIRDFDRNDHTVGGTDRVTVRRPSTGGGGATPRATSTPIPTVTPTPAPTATPQPTATPTPMPTPEPGPPGEKGEKGDKGDRGEQGEQGIQGERGETGLRGIQGRQGERGEQGIQGEQGEQGIQGERGTQGTRGEPGEMGPQGPQGVPGDKGGPGAQGEQGPQGDQGPAGGVIGVIALIIAIIVAVALGAGGIYIVSRR